MKSPCPNFWVLSTEQIFAKTIHLLDVIVLVITSYIISDLLSLACKKSSSSENFTLNNKYLIHFTWIILMCVYIHQTYIQQIYFI